MSERAREGTSEREREGGGVDGELIRVGILPATLHTGLLLVAM
jgi:hypothetical protein